MTPAQRHPAFSLIEVIFVVAIVAVLAAMAMPRISSATFRYRADAAAQRVAGDLNLARKRASHGSTAQKVIFNVDADSYRLPGWSDPDHPAAEYAVSLAGDPYCATIVSADFGGALEVTFDGYGVPDSAGTIVVQAGTYRRTISVDADTGRATVRETWEVAEVQSAQ